MPKGIVALPLIAGVDYQIDSFGNVVSAAGATADARGDQGEIKTSSESAQRIEAPPRGRGPSSGRSLAVAGRRTPTFFLRDADAKQLLSC